MRKSTLLSLSSALGALLFAGNARAQSEWPEVRDVAVSGNGYSQTYAQGHPLPAPIPQSVLIPAELAKRVAACSGVGSAECDAAVAALPPGYNQPGGYTLVPVTAPGGVITRTVTTIEELVPETGETRRSMPVRAQPPNPHSRR